MTTNHTPGPWEVRPSSNPKNGTLWRDVVSTGCEYSPSYVGEALEADARLIAAAPELLEALDELLAELDSREPPQGCIYRDTGGMELARSAIAKAEWQQ